MWISKTVLDEVKQFPLEGNNRWGEMIYSNLARRKGFKTIVLSSHLIHLGTSTKLKKDPLLSSNSWLIEKDMWSEISLKFLNDAPISNKLNSRFSTQFIDLIKNSKKLLIYGCGTISNYVSNSLKLKKHIDINVKERDYFPSKIKNRYTNIGNLNTTFQHDYQDALFKKLCKNNNTKNIMIGCALDQFLGSTFSNRSLTKIKSKNLMLHAYKIKFMIKNIQFNFKANYNNDFEEFLKINF